MGRGPGPWGRSPGGEWERGWGVGSAWHLTPTRAQSHFYRLVCIDGNDLAHGEGALGGWSRSGGRRGGAHVPKREARAA